MSKINCSKYNLPLCINPGTFSIIIALGQISAISLLTSEIKLLRSSVRLYLCVNAEKPWQGGHPTRRSNSPFERLLLFNNSVADIYLISLSKT